MHSIFFILVLIFGCITFFTPRMEDDEWGPLFTAAKVIFVIVATVGSGGIIDIIINPRSTAPDTYRFWYMVSQYLIFLGMWYIVDIFIQCITFQIKWLRILLSTPVLILFAFVAYAASMKEFIKYGIS